MRWRRCGGTSRTTSSRRLVHGIGATFGIEAFVWLTDVAGLSRDAAIETIRSNALAILRSALASRRADACRLQDRRVVRIL